MARGGTGHTSLAIESLFSDVVTSGSSVALYAGPDQAQLARDAAKLAYEQGAAWVEVIYTSAADNSYSSARESGSFDHSIRLEDEMVGPAYVWDEYTRDRYASALLTNALRIKDGDKLIIDALPEHAPVVEAVVKQAYEAGAHTVDVHYNDPHLDAIRAVNAQGDFTKSPEDWKRERIDLAMADGACYLAIQDNEHAGLVEAAHRERQRQEQATRRYDTHDTYFAKQQSNDVRWCIAQAPTQDWADKVYPELAGSAALYQLGQDVLEFSYCSVDDAPDSYERHITDLNSKAQWLNEQKIQRLIFTDPEGRELSMGLLEGARFLPCDWDTATGERFACNVPSSEIFTSPDPASASGRIKTTRPVMLSGRQVEEIELEFVDGKASLISCVPAHYGKVVEAYLRADAGSSRLGEVGIVAESRAGDKNRLYHCDIIDENASSHIALGYGYDAALDPDAPAQGTNNQSQIHVDLMVAGSNTGTRVEGVTADGRRLVIVDEASWAGGS